MRTLWLAFATLVIVACVPPDRATREPLPVQTTGAAVVVREPVTQSEPGRAEQKRDYQIERDAQVLEGRNPDPVKSSQRAIFERDFKTELAGLDSSVDVLKTDAAMQGPEARARIAEALDDLAGKRAKLELLSKRLEEALPQEWSKVRDDAQALLFDAKQALKALQDSL
jgi:hypothetical protein